VRVPAEPAPVPVTPAGAGVAVLVHAARARAPIAAVAMLMVLIRARRDVGPLPVVVGWHWFPFAARAGSGLPGVPAPGLGADLDSVPGGAERRGVGQVEVAHLVDGHAVKDRGGGDVDPLGDLGVLVPE
jgi:hypothetical protein